MSKTELAKIDDDAPDYGPVMQALPNDRERNYIVNLLLGMSGAASAKEAGFGNVDGTTTAENFARISHRLINRPRIIAALTEQTKLSIRSLGPTALQAAKNILTNSTHKGHERVVLALLDRVDPPQTNSTVQVSVTHRTEDIIDGVFAYFMKLRGLGMNRDKIFQEIGDEYLTKCERMLADGTGNVSDVVDAEFTELVDGEKPVTLQEL